MFKQVLVGFDGSAQAHNALVLAERLTAADGELVVCCVHRFDTVSARLDPVEPREDREAAEALAQEALRLVGERVKVTPLLLAAASSAIGLQHAAEQRHAELIVLGSSHHGTLGRVLVGSVSEGVLHGAPCPVLIVPRPIEAPA
jgi:nucleotide-binding universal stress UspA family protein